MCWGQGAAQGNLSKAHGLALTSGVFAEKAEVHCQTGPESWDSGPFWKKGLQGGEYRCPASVSCPQGLDCRAALVHREWGRREEEREVPKPRTLGKQRDG